MKQLVLNFFFIILIAPAAFAKVVTYNLEINNLPVNMSGNKTVYAPTWSWSAGIVFTEDSGGAGIQYKF